MLYLVPLSHRTLNMLFSYPCDIKAGADLRGAAGRGPCEKSAPVAPNGPNLLNYVVIASNVYM